MTPVALVGSRCGGVVQGFAGFGFGLVGGNGPIAAFADALCNGGLGPDLEVVDYVEHALGQGANASAAAYVETVDPEGTHRGIGVHASIVTASLRAVRSAPSRRATP